ncbi:MAG: excinuclease ABC subunit UvrA [Gemmatimonadales bacterium]|nr:excinuclease ABC subunit UvrA [Gemmatimonadales bacterium]
MPAAPASAGPAAPGIAPIEGIEHLEVIGAREHNLQNISLRLPRQSLIVVTGVSGSGKSSLAFDTIYAEGQRRYLETFSAYVRQFVGGLERPDVDQITGLSPVIAIDQKTTSRNPRSTVGTITEIYDFLRLLYARASEAFSYVSGRKMEKLSDEEIVQRIARTHAGQHVALLAPVVKGRKGHYREDLEKIRKQGFTKARIDGVIVDLEPRMSLDRYKTHDIEVVVDRLKLDDTSLARLTQSVTTTLNAGKNSLLLQTLAPGHKPVGQPVWYCRDLMDPESGISYDEPAPNSFSFNSPYGACPTCDGLGRVMELNLAELVPDPAKTIAKGALAVLEEAWMQELTDALKALARAQNFKLSTPWEDYPAATRELILYGDPELDPRELPREGEVTFINGRWVGLRNFLRMRYLNFEAESVRGTAERFLAEAACPTCLGARLKKESLHFKIDDRNIHELATMDLRQLGAWFDTVEPRLSPKQQAIAHELLKEIRKRIGFLLEVGLDYLALDRPAKSLSGGEAQRIRLATQIGSQLAGVLYILDEPSIGLHQRDNQRLITSLKALRDLGNTVLVVEHDRDMMLAADYLIDIGPGAGMHGGRIVAQGTPDQFLAQPSVTGDYLSGRRQIPLPAERRKPGDKRLVLRGATGHNLKNVTLDIPLGLFVGITGVSGSGKSSLINQTLYPILHTHSFDFKKATLPYAKVEGLKHVDKVIEIDQKPIGRTPRSNPATYAGVFTYIRELFSELPESKIRGYAPGRFSFNVKGGRCETCGGAGVQVIEMNFLPDVHVPCPTCRGRRYNRETLEVRYKGKSIADVLDLTVADAMDFFSAQTRIAEKLSLLNDVGLGYLHLGQAATTLSGGEAQRVKLATELAKRDTGRTLYILDEPTTGLHFEDVRLLLEVLHRLVDKGNSVVVIEHNLDVIKTSDWVVDLGPEGGVRGGNVVAAGTPEEVALVAESHTGRFLARTLGV